MNVREFFTPSAGKKAGVALFLSGTGSNADVLLKYAENNEVGFEISVLVTDAPDSSAAKKLSAEYDLPLVSCDIRKFYIEHGENSIKLDTPRRRMLRDRWSDVLWQQLQSYRIDFGVFAGFIPLSNIVSKLFCLNVHPGDLTVEEEGKRIFAGLHILPVENAILRGCADLRSSVILAQGYCGSGKKEMDSGPVLGISQMVPVDLFGYTVDELREIRDMRGKAPFDDPLRTIALKNIETLKTGGDHLVLPAATEMFARGRYGQDENGNFCFLNDDGEWKNIKTAEFLQNGEIILHYDQRD